jgi:hypothetical protein
MLMIEFQKILTVCKLLGKEYPSHVFIGGVAVFLHAINDTNTKDSAESSHDADFMLSMADFGDLRDTDEVTANRRLNKHQIIRKGIEFDVYVEHQNKLIVPYREAATNARRISGVNVACPEHLLVLKLVAQMDRAGSAKGAKDERDLLTIVRVMKGKFKDGLILPYLRRKQVEALMKILQSNVFVHVSRGNVQKAKKLRELFAKFVNAIDEQIT